MTYSPLTNEAMPPTGKYWNGKAWVNKWSPRPAGVRVNGLNVHHHAATSDAGIYRLVTSNDPASANYIIRNNGSLIGSVPEEFRAWTTSAYVNDDDKITVEIQNETGAPDWRISAAAMATLIRLYVDLARRYSFAPVRANLKGHQEYGVATACPGPYLLPRLDDVARKAAALGTTTEDEDMPTAAEIADAVLNYKHPAFGIDAQGKATHSIIDALAEVRGVTVGSIPRAGTGQTGTTSLRAMVANSDDHTDRILQSRAEDSVDLPALAALVVPPLIEALPTALEGGKFVTTTESAATFVPATDQS